MADLFDPPPGDRDGGTYEHENDYVRLNRQATDVWRAIRDQRWRTLRDISLATGHPEASVSARLRDFRKGQFGAHAIERLRLTGGLYAYRLIPNAAVKLDTYD